MKQATKRIGFLLSASMMFSCMSALPAAEAADGEQIISFGEAYSFDKFTLSYKDAQTENVEIAFSEDGQNFSDYQTVSFSNDTLKAEYLNDTVKAKFAKIKAGNAGLPKVELEQVKRYDATKDNVGSGIRGIDGNTKSMWSAGHDNFAMWFDGTYDENGVLTNLGPKQSMGLNHDAVKEGKTENYDEGMVELNFVFPEKIELESVVMYMDSTNCSEYKISIPDENGTYTQVAGRTMSDFPADKQTLPSWAGEKSFYYLKDHIGAETDTFKIRWEKFQNIKESDKSSYVDMFEMAFYYYDEVYESEFVLHDGAEFTFDKPETFARIVGGLPDDMWYVGTTTGGGEVDFRSKADATGYFADAPAEIAKVKIRGYNEEKVNEAALPKTLNLYGEVSDLAKAAYQKDANAVSIEGRASDADFGDDSRAPYMTVAKETGIAALFDGDEQYNSIHPYHTFVDADPDRLTLKADSSITVDLGSKAVIDTVSYYAGPQYTPKKYSVLVSDTAEFKNARTALEKSYEVLEGRLSPFTNNYGEYYCAMHEDQSVKGIEGRYVKVINDGVLKPESDHLVINNENGEVVVDTVMQNDASLNKNVILAKELKIMGAELVDTVQTSSEGELSAVCTYNDNNTAAAGKNTVHAVITNDTKTAAEKLAVYAAVYSADGRLKSVKSAKVESVAANNKAEVNIENVEAEQGDSVGAFVWIDSMESVGSFDKVTVQ